MLFSLSDQIYRCIYGLFTCHIHRSNLVRQRILRFHAKNILFYILHKYCVCFEHSKAYETVVYTKYCCYVRSSHGRHFPGTEDRNLHSKKWGRKPSVPTKGRGRRYKLAGPGVSEGGPGLDYVAYISFSVVPLFVDCTN